MRMLTSAQTRRPATTTRRDRAFRLLVAGQALSRLGDGLFAAAVAWTAWRLERSAWAVGAVELAAWSLRIAAFYLGGTLADRHDRRRTMIACGLARSVLVTALALLLLAQSLGIGILLACSAGVGLASAPFEAARFAIVPEIAGRSGLVRANAVVQLGNRLAFAIGPLLLAAGGGFPLSTIMMVDGIAFCLSAVAIRAMGPWPKAGQLPRSAHTGGPSFTPTRRPPFRLATLQVRPPRRITDVSLAIAASAVGILFVSGFRTVGLTAMVGTRLGDHMGTYGILNGVLGVSEIAGALALQRIRMPNLAAWATISWVVLGVFRAPLGLPEQAVVAAALLSVTGLASAAADVSLMSLVQSRVGQERLGTTFGAWQALTSAAAALSPILAAFVFSHVGIATGFALSGLAAATFGFAAWLWTARIDARPVGIGGDAYA